MTIQQNISRTATIADINGYKTTVEINPIDLPLGFSQLRIISQFETEEPTVKFSMIADPATLARLKEIL